MSDYRGPGYWLPDPCAGFGTTASEERNRRMKFFGAWFARGVMLIAACLGGLIFTEANLSFLGACFAVAATLGGGVIVAVLVLAAVWSDL